MKSKYFIEKAHKDCKCISCKSAKSLLEYKKLLNKSYTGLFIDDKLKKKLVNLAVKILIKELAIK